MVADNVRFSLKPIVCTPEIIGISLELDVIMVAVSLTSDVRSSCIETTTVSVYVRSALNVFFGICNFGDVSLFNGIPTEGTISHWNESFEV